MQSDNHRGINKKNRHPCQWINIIIIKDIFSLVWTHHSPHQPPSPPSSSTSTSLCSISKYKKKENEKNQQDLASEAISFFISCVAGTNFILTSPQSQQNLINNGLCSERRLHELIFTCHVHLRFINILATNLSPGNVLWWLYLLTSIGRSNIFYFCELIRRV